MDFELADDKSYIRIIESCIKKEKQGAILGKAFVNENTGNAKWDVEHFWPFSDELYIIALADDYSWCMTGNPNRKELAVYSRTTSLSDSLYNDLVKQAGGLSFDTSRIVKVVHNCN
ncbi:MAG: lipocalin family protein [Bacteroidetes bacterium]|nr:lipocalin family protein [Bacteroidota bacterium]